MIEFFDAQRYSSSCLRVVRMLDAARPRNRRAASDSRLSITFSTGVPPRLAENKASPSRPSPLNNASAPCRSSVDQRPNMLSK